MTGQEWRVTEEKERRELNKTPLSQECKRLLKDPWVGSLYLLQALEQAMEENKPDWGSSAERRSQTVWREISYLLEDLEYRFLPKTAYNLITTSGDLPEEEANDTALLEEMKKDPEDELGTLLDLAMMNLQSNGFILDGTYPV